MLCGLGHGSGIAVKGNDFVAVFEQSPGHIAAHAAEANHRQLHLRLLHLAGRRSYADQ